MVSVTMLQGLASEALKANVLLANAVRKVLILVKSKLRNTSTWLTHITNGGVLRDFELVPLIGGQQMFALRQVLHDTNEQFCKFT